MKAELNGNFHGTCELPPGIEYLGDGRWSLPAGATADCMESGGDESGWLITLSDGTEYHAWTEDM